MVGSQLGLRLTPQLQFLYDEIPEEAHEIDDVIELARRRDEELKRTRQHAHYAADPDPYRHESDDTDDDAGDADTSHGRDRHHTDSDETETEVNGDTDDDDTDDSDSDGGDDSDDDYSIEDEYDEEFVSEASYAQFLSDGADPFDGERAYDESGDDDTDEDQPPSARDDASYRSQEHE